MSTVPLYAQYHAFGWHEDPVASAKCLAEIRQTQNSPVLFRDAARDWIDLEDDDHPFCIWMAEERVLGSIQPSWNQGSAGTCFPAGTLVRMADGSEKPIEDIQAGEYVITHKSRPRQVLKSFRRKYSGELITLKAGGCPSSVTATADHKFVHYHQRSSGSKDKRRYRVGLRSENYQWTAANDLAIGERILVPLGLPCPETDAETIDAARLVPDAAISTDGMALQNRSGQGHNVKRFIPVGPDLGRLIGLYLSEGSLHTSSRGKGSGMTGVVFSFNINETNLASDILELVKKLFGLTGRQKEDAARHTRKVFFDSCVFAAFVHALMPGKAISKRLPVCILRASKETRMAALRGWMDGDGHFSVRKNSSANARQLTATGVSSSAGLRRDMHALAVSCGLRPRVTVRKQMAHQNAAAGHVTFYSEQAVEIRPSLQSEWDAVKQRPSKKVDKTDLGIAATIKQKATSYMEDGTVYCLEVNEDHSFIANGYGVSNCVSFGWGRGCNDALLFQVSEGTSEWPGANVATEPIYGGSRVEVGGGSIWGDGSVGTWAGKWVKDWGVLLRQKYLDKYDLSKYSIDISRSWGRSGVPNDLEPIAKKYPVKAVALVTNAKDAWAALGNGNVIPICSNWGFDSPLIEGFCAPSGSWNHCMCIRARVVCKYKGVRVRGFGVQNSWGNNLKGEPRAFFENGDAFRLPEGLFFVQEQYIDKMLAQKDSMAISNVDGFPKKNFNLDWYF